MEELWKRFTSIFRKTPSTLKPDAESLSATGSPSAPESNQSTAESAYIAVSKPDAIAELCLKTGDEQLDYIHVILIDLLQKDLIGAVRMETDKTLRYFATDSGKKYVEEHFHEAIDILLERIFGDNK